MLKVKEWLNKLKKKQFDVIFNENGDRYAKLLRNGQIVYRFQLYAVKYLTRHVFIEILSFREDRIRIQFKLYDKDKNYVSTQVAEINDIEYFLEAESMPRRRDNHA